MKFFIPNLGSDNVEVYYAGIRSFLTDECGLKLTARRIHSISYSVKGERQEAAVGRKLPGSQEIVFAIFESSNAYIVCTPQRGVTGQMPVKVKRREVAQVTDFDAAEAQQPA